MTPTPSTYVAALVVGSAVGVIGAALTGVAWWPFPIAAVIFAWTVFQATAFIRPWNRARVRERVRMTVVSPPKRSAYEFAQMCETARRAAFPIYGLAPDWRGVRRLAGVSWSSSDVTTVTLGHLSPASDSELRVRSGQLSSMDPWDLMRRRVLHASGEPPKPTPVRVRVDGRVVELDACRHDNQWWAAGSTDESVVMLQGRGFPRDDLDLVRIEDLDAYLADASPAARP